MVGDNLIHAATLQWVEKYLTQISMSSDREFPDFGVRTEEHSKRGRIIVDIRRLREGTAKITDGYHQPRRLKLYSSSFNAWEGK